MAAKKTIITVVKTIAVIAGTIVLYIAAVYLFVFRPTFLRQDVSTKKPIKYFKTQENYKKHLQDEEELLKFPHEEISITSVDNLKLVGINFPAENAKGTLILLHGYHSDPLREYASLAKFYYEAGYNVILPYHRTHGKSEGKYITFGVKERYDLRDWVFKANSLYGSENPLYLQGISMGCATTLMTLGFDLPKNVLGAIADCGFTTPSEIIWKVLKKDRKIPTAPLIFKLGNKMANMFADFDFDDYSTLTALKHNSIPVLFIHGTADDFVPIEMTIANFQFCRAKKDLYLVEGCPHAIANLVDEEKYHKRVIDFMTESANQAEK